mmetsp:Transcript_41010/g.131880  ORF Transcript_41010/g.131880 Transcript_41010/m.131880 type:complete len:115 (+) Transcript_41010:875-1219(+)
MTVASPICVRLASGSQGFSDFRWQHAPWLVERTHVESGGIQAVALWESGSVSGDPCCIMPLVRHRKDELVALCCRIGSPVVCRTSCSLFDIVHELWRRLRSSSVLLLTRSSWTQ